MPSSCTIAASKLVLTAMASGGMVPTLQDSTLQDQTKPTSTAGTQTELTHNGQMFEPFDNENRFRCGALLMRGLGQIHEKARMIGKWEEEIRAYKERKNIVGGLPCPEEEKWLARREELLANEIPTLEIMKKKVFADVFKWMDGVKTW